MKKIFLVSYFSTDDSVMSHWLKDKIFALNQLNFYPVIITSTCNPKLKNIKNHTKYYRVPPISFRLSTEYFLKDLKSNSLTYFLFLPFNLTFGLIWDLVEFVILRRIGGGFWSWVPSVFFTLLFLSIFNKTQLILSTGGPTSALLGTAFFGRVFNKSTILELQDPLVGTSIGHKGSKFKLAMVENLLIKYSTKVVYVTKKAAEEAQIRHCQAKNINHIYTSSRNFFSFKHNSTKEKLNELKIVHFGTLYGSRNFNNLIIALNKIKKNNPEIKIELTNIGSNYAENYEKNLFKINYLSAVRRENIINVIGKHNLVLIVQHTDDRSLLTIPYKTWDYLNVAKPIFGLTNSCELDSLLLEHGHFFANNKDVLQIEKTLKKILSEKSSFTIRANKYNLIKQVEKLITL